MSTFKIKNIARCMLLVLMSWHSITFAAGWHFDVYLDKQKIGTHHFHLSGDKLMSQADFKVKVLFINAYQYHHEAAETWNGDCLVSLKAHTVENKDITDVRGEIKNQQFEVEKSGKQQTLPACTMTFAYWNPAILKQSRLLNPQNAEYLDIEMVDEGDKPFSLRGNTINAHQYRLMGRLEGKVKLNITLWYDQQQWVGLQSLTPEGYIITYKLI